MPPLPVPRRILICPDSFKGSLTAVEAARAIARGVKRALPRARALRLPLADGGEGTLDALAHAIGGRRHARRVRGPLGRPVPARWLELADGTGVVELAQAAGLTLLSPGRRDPMTASTFGVGQLIGAALDRGCRRVVVTLGGSATVDGGAGMAEALGARLLDRAGRPVPPGGAGLRLLRRVELGALRNRLRGAAILGATDVRAPLLGPGGAAPVFGPQKGASPAQVRALASGLARLAACLRRATGVELARRPGSGAAGGTGAGLIGFCGGRLVGGADWLFARTGFRERLAGCDLVITGEGNLDPQTRMGKLVSRVGAEARRAGTPALAYAGRVWISPAAVRRLGLLAAHAVTPADVPARAAFRGAAARLERTVAATLAARFGNGHDRSPGIAS